MVSRFGRTVDNGDVEAGIGLLNTLRAGGRVSGKGGRLGSTDEKTSRSPTADFDLNNFCIPFRHDDLAGFVSGVRMGENSGLRLDREGYVGGDSIDAVERAGELRREAGVGGKQGSASIYDEMLPSQATHRF